MEGDTDDPAILDMRDRMRRNLMATQLVSQGTPMLLMGDEVGRTQFGNNNAYCQDTEMSWLAWTDGDAADPGTNGGDGHGPRDKAFLAFTRALVALRRDLGILSQADFLHGQPVPGLERDGVKDVSWMKPDGAEMVGDDWHAGDPKEVAMVFADAAGRRVVVFVNGSVEAVTFALPETMTALGWSALFCTATGNSPSRWLGTGRSAAVRRGGALRQCGSRAARRVIVISVWQGRAARDRRFRGREGSP